MAFLLAINYFIFSLFAFRFLTLLKTGDRVDRASHGKVTTSMMAVGITRIPRKLTANDSRGVQCKTLKEYRDKYY